MRDLKQLLSERQQLMSEMLCNPKLKMAVCTLFNAVYKAITFCLSVVQFQLQHIIGTIRINIKIQIKCLSWNLGLQRFDLGSYQDET